MLDSGIMLYDWMENNVSQSDGSWINDFSNPWKGASVFGAISLGEGIKNCGGIFRFKPMCLLSTYFFCEALFLIIEILRADSPFH